MLFLKYSNRGGKNITKQVINPMGPTCLKCLALFPWILLKPQHTSAQGIGSSSLKDMTDVLRPFCSLHSSFCCFFYSFLYDNDYLHCQIQQRLVCPQQNLLSNLASLRRYQSLPSHDLCHGGAWEEDAAFPLCPQGKGVLSWINRAPMPWSGVKSPTN